MLNTMNLVMPRAYVGIPSGARETMWGVQDRTNVKHIQGMLQPYSFTFS